MSEQAIVVLGSADVADLHAWVEDQKKQKAARIVLRMRSDTGSEIVVREQRLDGEDVPSGSDIADTFLSRARNNACTQPGRSVFGVSAQNAAGGLVDSFSFVVTNQADARTVRDVNVELTALLMRHTEAAARLSLGHTLALVNKYRELLESREAEIASLRGQLATLTAEYEQTTALRFEREMTVLKHSDDRELSRYAREKFDLVLPVFMSKLVPQLATAGAGYLLEEQVEKILASLKSEQIARIVSVLDPPQQIAFGELITAYNARGLKRAEERDARARANDADKPSEATHAAA